MLTPEQKALDACVRYVEAQTEVKRLTSAIGDALFHCPLSLTADEADSHLKRAYRAQWGINETTLGNCPQCIAAHALVQERKRARIAFGNAKRAITCVGKAQRETTP